MLKVSGITPTDEEMLFVVEAMRNPMNSWDKSDKLGEADYKLMMNLVRAGAEHRKFMRQMFLGLRITAPMYWWTEFDTYKVGTARNSTSKMHKLMAKPFEKSDFAMEYLGEKAENVMCATLNTLNSMRTEWLSCTDDTEKKKIWYALLQFLPESYLQTSNVSMNYEVARNIYHQRRRHKLDEWHDFCDFLETLPYAEFITEGMK